MQALDLLRKTRGDVTLILNKCTDTTDNNNKPATMTKVEDPAESQQTEILASEPPTANKEPSPQPEEKKEEVKEEVKEEEVKEEEKKGECYVTLLKSAVKLCPACGAMF